MTSTFGTATANNPRPFKCTDCKSAFRIHGHLAKHLRSKMHIMKLECLRKLPFGMYAEMERSSINLNDIDTTDCVSSLTSLQIMAQKLFAGDPTKLNQWETEVDPYRAISSGDTSSDDEGVNITTSHSIIRCSATGKPKNDHGGIGNSSCECQLCSEPMKNVDELQVHRLLEHNIGTVNFTTAIAPLRQDEKLEEKENTQDFIVRKKCIK